MSEREYRPFPRENRRDEAHGEGEVPLLVALVPIAPGARILEIGCGPGATLVPLAELVAPARLCGIDVDQDLLDRAAVRLAAAEVDAELHCGDVRALPFSDASFDVVLDFGTCYHIARAVDGLAEIERVLAPGGTFITETVLNQRLSHPIRSWGRRMPWAAAPALMRTRRTLMWEARVRA